MLHSQFKSLFLATLASLSFAGHAYAADVYPADLAKRQPAIASAFSKLTKTIARKHKWIRDFGVTPPVAEIVLDNETYVRLSGCKPHDCPFEKYVVLVSKKNNKAVGAFLTNKETAAGYLSDSTIQWLGQPTDEQVVKLAGLLFPGADR